MILEQSQKIQNLESRLTLKKSRFSHNASVKNKAVRNENVVVDDSGKDSGGQATMLTEEEQKTSRIAKRMELDEETGVEPIQLSAGSLMKKSNS